MTNKAETLKFAEHQALNIPVAVCSTCGSKLRQNEVIANELQRLKINEYLCEHCYAREHPDEYEWIHDF